MFETALAYRVSSNLAWAAERDLPQEGRLWGLALELGAALYHVLRVNDPPVPSPSRLPFTV